MSYCGINCMVANINLRMGGSKSMPIVDHGIIFSSGKMED